MQRGVSGRDNYLAPASAPVGASTYADRRVLSVG